MVVVISFSTFIYFYLHGYTNPHKQDLRYLFQMSVAMGMVRLKKRRKNLGYIL